MRLSRLGSFSIMLLLAACCTAVAQTGGNVAATKHNLSVSGPGTVVSTNQNQVCVFCHTPHGATLSPGTPLWNRDLSVQTYTTYTSSSLDAEIIAGQSLEQPAGASKLCLSCHDGSMAIGMVNVAGGEVDVNIPMSGVGAGGEMPAGAGLQTGFTRNLGTDLTNDHPISLTFDATLVAADGELRDPATTPEVGLRSPGVKPQFPLEATGPFSEPQLQCISCHDPHLADGLDGPNKFLRGRRLQQFEPAGGAFDADVDQVCLACHDKEGWVGSVHATSTAANETYLAGDAALREFPANTAVWQAACLNCHDTHTVHGSRRLLREGTDSLASPKTSGNPATEETCYQCHGNVPVINNVASEVKNIEADFLLATRMPITGIDQPRTPEAHDIVDANGIEPRVNLGRTDSFNRHAECTDCHNPHRAMKNALFNGTGAQNSTHEHAAGHTNLASGALAGTWGVEPIYGGTEFLADPATITFEVKQGIGMATDVTAPHVTREYQVCLKCHSHYGYDDDGNYPVGTRPNLGASGGGTPPGTNNMQQYTNQAMEFQAPLSDQGAQANNHRSWHPVMAPTGRTLGLRGMGTGAFLAPWTNDVGTQTMYCSDCHGSNTAQTTVVPTGNRPWGPHGSENDFILKGPWNISTGSSVGAPGAVNTLCFRCHDPGDYTGNNRGAGTSGFSDGNDNLHTLHSEQLQRIRCNWCHVAVPHGWKNKALLVNLNDVGLEAGLVTPTEVPINSAGQTYNVGPYYMNAKLKIRNFAPSGNWQEANCGSANNQQGPDDSIGRDWMRAVCEVPP
jgi:hypothetical protein